MILIFSTVWCLLPDWKQERQRKIDRTTETGTDRQSNKERQTYRYGETATEWLRERNRDVDTERQKQRHRDTETERQKHRDWETWRLRYRNKDKTDDRDLETETVKQRLRNRDLETETETINTTYDEQHNRKEI